MDFTEIYQSANNELKNNLLLSILMDNAKYRKEFLDKIGTSPIVSTSNLVEYKEFSTLINLLIETNISLMESLDLEDLDYEGYCPSHDGYMDHWEVDQEIAQAQADKLFSTFKENLNIKLLENNLELLIAELIAFVIASKDAEIEDEYCNLGDPANDYFIEMCDSYILYAIEKIRISTISDTKIINSIKMFFEYFENEKHEYFDTIIAFQQLLITLLDKVENTNIIPPFDDITDIESEYCPVFAIDVSSKLGNTEQWLAQAQENLFLDKQIGERLLDYYYQNNREKYIATANKLLSNDKEIWANYIKPIVSKEDNFELYKEVNIQYCLNHTTLSDYVKLKAIITDDDKEYIIEKLGYNHEFKVRIYQYEKQFEKIKDIVITQADSYNIAELISPILTVYQEFSFRFLEEKTYNLITKERGRSAYKNIINLLELMKVIPDYKTQTSGIVKALYNHKPNLPALKDEFRNAGIMEGILM